jgi:hypothetical protein
MLCLLASCTNLELQPKFLSKEERAQIALEKRQKEVEALKQRQEDARKSRMPASANTQTSNRTGAANGPTSTALKSNQLMNEAEMKAIRVF